MHSIVSGYSRKQRRVLSTVIFLAIFVLFLSLPAASTQNNSSLLDEGFDLSQKLGGQERVYYLAELCTTAAKLEAPSEKIKYYSWALFRRASNEEDSNLRTAGQKNAASCLSYADPDSAMALLLQIDFEPPKPGETIREDPRYNAAQVTFRNFLDKAKPQTLSAIIADARYLGKTGQYPYRAIADAIRIPGFLNEEINTLFGDALNFYATETGFYNRDEEFLFLLQSLKDSHVDHRVMVQAVGTFVHRLKQDPIQYPGSYYAEIHTSDGKAFPFTDRNQAFLFQAFPLIKRFDPALAVQLRQQDPQLAQTTDEMRYVSGGFIKTDPRSDEATQQRLTWFGESILERIDDCRESNPEVAVSLAQQLSSPSLRIIGFSKAVTGLAHTNALEASRIYEKQLSELKSLNNSPGKLKATVALVPAAYSVGDLKHYQSLSVEAFEAGIAFFVADTEADRAQNRTGLAELQDLVTFTASLPKDVLDSPVQQLPDGWLKAYLWIYQAMGHASRMQTRRTGNAEAATCEKWKSLGRVAPSEKPQKQLNKQE